jgi:hypothetical protein
MNDFLVMFESCFSSENREIMSFSTSAISIFLVQEFPHKMGNDLSQILEGFVSVLVENIKGNSF